MERNSRLRGVAQELLDIVVAPIQCSDAKLTGLSSLFDDLLNFRVSFHLCCGLVLELVNLVPGVEPASRGRVAIKDYKETSFGPSLLFNSGSGACANEIIQRNGGDQVLLSLLEHFSECLAPRLDAVLGPLSLFIPWGFGTACLCSPPDPPTAFCQPRRSEPGKEGGKDFPIPLQLSSAPQASTSSCKKSRHTAPGLLAGSRDTAVSILPPRTVPGPVPLGVPHESAVQPDEESSSRELQEPTAPIQPCCTSVPGPVAATHTPSEAFDDAWGWVHPIPAHRSDSCSAPMASSFVQEGVKDPNTWTAQNLDFHRTGGSETGGAATINAHTHFHPTACGVANPSGGEMIDPPRDSHCTAGSASKTTGAAKMDAPRDSHPIGSIATRTTGAAMMKLLQPPMDSSLKLPQPHSEGPEQKSRGFDGHMSLLATLGAREKETGKSDSFIEAALCLLEATCDEDLLKNKARAMLFLYLWIYKQAGSTFVYPNGFGLHMRAGPQSKRPRIATLLLILDSIFVSLRLWSLSCGSWVRVVQKHVVRFTR